MKKRLAFFAWFVIAALGCVALAGMGFSGMALSSRHKVAALGAGIVAVCALIGMIFPDKMERLFFGKDGVHFPNERKEKE